MDGNRNMRFPGQPPGNYNMMQGPPQQFVQQGMPMYPMMQQPHGMIGPVGPMMQHPGMFPMQGMPVRPGIRPPTYNQAITENYRHRGAVPPRPGRPLSPNSQRRLAEQEHKDKKFQTQQQRLKQFHKTAPVDADKFIESMFGKTEKPKPIEKPELQVLQESTDDSFGDFLGGPSVTSNAMGEDSIMNSKEDSQTSQTLSEVNLSQVKEEEKKDLMSMMMECSDLSNQSKPKSFHHKPALKELNPTHQSNHIQIHNQSRHARHWKDEEELSGLFTVSEREIKEQQANTEAKAPHPKVQKPFKFELPSWCKDDEKVPIVYKQVLEAATCGGVIMTDRLYPILLMSGLPKETLGQIWSLANQTTPGQLIKSELYLILALMAFAQNNYTSLTVDMLHKCPQPPIPFLGQRPMTSPPHDQAQQSPLQMPYHDFTQVSSINQQNVAMPPSGTPPVQSIGPQTQMIPPGVQSTTTNSLTTPTTGNVSVASVSEPLPGMFQASVAVTGTVTNAQSFQTSTDEEFADFQEAPSVASTVSDASLQKTEKNIKEETEYLYSVPKLTDEQLASELSPEMEHSNVRNFFGSDDSSVSASPQRHLITDKKGASTPNSLDEDFDDFKSAGSKPSDSSQFTSSEQSENEDFKVFESYLDDFNKRKSDCQQESPLHRPIPKFSSSQASQLPSTATVMAVPAMRNLWPSPETTTITTSLDVKSSTLPNSKIGIMNTPTLGLSPPQSSDSDFADFQQAPIDEPKSEQMNKLPADLKQAQNACLLGEEDKYAALRVLEVAVETPVTSVFESNPDSAEKVTTEEDDGWADFQAVGSENIDADVSETAKTTEKTNLDFDINDTPKDNWADFQGSAKQEASSDWSAFAEPAKSTESNWSNFSSVALSTANSETTNSDDWTGFQGTEDRNLASDEVSGSSAKDSSATKDTSSTLVHVKKSNLDSSEILGLFKVRDEPLFVPSLNAKENSRESGDKKTTDVNDVKTESSDSSSSGFVQKFPVSKSVLETNLDVDDDPFRVPPPIDEGHDDDDGFGEFSRGYDIEDIVHPPPQKSENKKNLYNFYGIDSTPMKSSKNVQKSYADVDSSVEQGEDENRPMKDVEMVNWNSNLDSKAEDTQSITSLEFPSTKKVQNLKDLDTQSVSSGEYGNFETHLKPSINPESKSVDSLDLKETEADSLEQSEGDSVIEQTNISEKEVIPPKIQDTVEEVSTTNDVSQNPLPVLGDRYSTIIEDIPGSDKHAFEWQRCLENCSRMVKDANNIFNSISSSAVCNEVIRSEQGSEYVQGIVEIYRVVCRITASMKSAALSTDKLKQMLKEIDLAWNNLTAFLVGGNMMPDDNTLNFKSAVLKSDDNASQYKACGVCLQNVDIRSKNFNCDEDCAKLLYGGRQYHASCANFWVNCVDSLLPALKLPELL